MEREEDRLLLGIPPGKLTWNLKILNTPLEKERTSTNHQILFGFHVSFLGMIGVCFFDGNLSEVFARCVKLPCFF